MIDLLETIWNVMLEYGVDRSLLGGALRILLPRAQRYLGSAWRWCRPKLVTKYEAAKSAHPWRKAFAALTIPSIVGGLIAGLMTGGIDGTASPWAMCWFGSAMVVTLLVAVLDSFPTRRPLP